MTTILSVTGLQAWYGLTKALHGIDFQVQDGGITALLGANGAGKTTTLRGVCGMLKTAGTIEFAGTPIQGKSTEDVARMGIAHVVEGRGTFVKLSVEENLLLGAYGRGTRTGVKEDIERVYTYFPVLKERRMQQAGTLSGGEQQMLAVSRALMLRPKLLLLDEPSFGLAPIVVEDIFRIMRTINRESKVSMLLVEQNAALALDVATHAYLLETGHLVMSGPAAEFRQNDAIRRTYLGY